MMRLYMVSVSMKEESRAHKSAGGLQVNQVVGGGSGLIEILQDLGVALG